MLLHNSVVDKHVTLTQFLPLFYEKADTATMMKHGMNVLRWWKQVYYPVRGPTHRNCSLEHLWRLLGGIWLDQHLHQSRNCFFISVLGYCSIYGNHWFNYCEGTSWTQLSSLCGNNFESTGSMVFRPGPSQLCQVDSNSYLWYGKSSSINTCRILGTWQLGCPENSKSVLSYASRPGARAK